MESLSFGDEFAACSGGASLHCADHLCVVVVEGDRDGGVCLAAGDGLHQVQQLRTGFCQTRGAGLDGSVVVDLDRPGVDFIPLVARVMHYRLVVLG